MSSVSVTTDKHIFNCDSVSAPLTASHRYETSAMQDSSYDLQWCTELDYHYMSESQRAPKSIFENSLLASSNSNYITPPSSNYVNISKNIDANLAEIDIETFRSEDINAVFQQHRTDECSSLAESLFDEDSSSLRSLADLKEDLILLNRNKTVQSYNDNCDKDEEKANKKVSSNTDISVDSLDTSFLTNDTSKLLMKCTEQDKKRYTIAFEESITASQDLIDSNYQQKFNSTDKYNSNYETNKRNMIKSENFNSALRYRESNEQMNSVYRKTADLIMNIDNSANKLSQSIPNIRLLSRIAGTSRMPYCPVSGFIPLYDLQSSQSSNSHSSSSEFSPPRSLVRMFMQNRSSPLSSGQISPSLSFESHSQASSPVYSLTSKLNYNSLDSNREANNNVTYISEYETSNVSNVCHREETQLFDENVCKNKLRIESQKLAYNMKNTFPIKEVDETLSDSSNTDINMSSIDGCDINCQLPDLNKNPIPVKCHQYYPKSKYAAYEALSESHSSKPNDKYLNSSSHNTGVTSVSTKSNPNSLSSGYNSSRFGFESLNGLYIGNNNRLFNQKIGSSINTKTTATQIPVHFRDKEVQACISGNCSEKYICKGDMKADPNAQHSCLDLSPNEHNKRSLHVYYPNYSLPDLSFLQEIFEMGQIDNRRQTIHLSPTKHKLPNRDSASVRMRERPNNKTQTRPKSYTDYETLSKHNFSHIKDWDSLNILLPNEFKTLIQRAQNVENFADNENIPNKSDTSFKNHESKSNCNVRLRSHKNNAQKLKYGESHNHYSIKGNRGNKRYSLQEPFSTFMKPTNYYNDSNSCNNNEFGCMSRSTTMPSYHNCHCYQHCYHNCCHSCCHSSCHSPSTPSAKPLPHSNCDTNSNSIDKLCQILAMDLSFKKIMDIINNQITSSNKQCEQSIQKNESNKTILKENDENNGNKDGTNFKELRKHWESLATSPGSSTNSLTPGTGRKESTPIHQPVIKEKSKPAEDVTNKPLIARKPKLELRKPMCYTPCMIRPTTLNTDNPVNSQRKSMIPIAKGGQSKSPTFCGTKVKSISTALK